MITPLVFIPGVHPPQPGPLARYLPPVNDGTAASWLAGRVPAGAWVLDPFGASPRMAIELARAGYRVLVAANNPVARFVIEMLAAPPAEANFIAALADLGGAFKGAERIEPHIRSLYMTDCAACRHAVMAEAFLWERGAAGPYARVYHCPNCHDEGERPVEETDVALAARFAESGLHRARALERVAGINDPDREHAEEALNVYPPRAVYALFTLINKLDGLGLPLERRRLLNALLLSACDQGNTLWPHPTGRERPRQLVIPPRYRENNVWLAIEKAIQHWAVPGPATPVTRWPQTTPESGGVCLFEGRLKDLAASLSQVSLQAVAAALPRPNQAFWTLSALWAGWLWGQEAAAPFKGVLRRRRYDWAWHTTALTAAFDSLTPHLSPGTPVYGLIGEVEAGFFAAAVIAGDAAGLDLAGQAMRTEGGQAQILWLSEEHSAEIASSAGRQVDLAQTAVSDYLHQRGEPAAYLPLSAAVFTSLAQAHTFRAERVQRAVQEAIENTEPIEPSLAVIYTQTQAIIRETLTYRGGFLRYGAGEALDSGQWWLRETHRPTLSLADRVEMALVTTLNQQPGCTEAEIDANLRGAFPGSFTPEIELVQVILESYGEPFPADKDRWQLRREDAPALRRAELNAVRSQIEALGRKLGYTTHGETPLIWLDVDQIPRLWFYPKASAVIGEILTASPIPPERGLIVFPGGRANLVAYKLRRDPRLAQASAAGWRFLKFRHLRSLLELPMSSPEHFDAQVALDQLTYAAPQMRLL